MTDFITISNMNCSIRDIHILKDISLVFTDKGFTSLTGPNGSGKTTLGKVMTGILPFQSGQVSIEGKDIRSMSLPQIGRKIGYLFQNPDKQIFAPTVFEELAFGMKFKNCGEDEIRERTDEMLDIFDLKSIRDSTSYFLSQGEKQRLAIAAVLLNDPEFLILDEPTTGLDIKRKEDLSRYLDRIKSKVGILMISHDKSFIDRHSDRIIKLEGGCVKYDKRC
ncbi:energy-coupling factor transport system ATP-binding protein [Dethiosulfatibacter aminovorans DSM 17477]|uniref:Energy-coupling factor transport system ATP-binding protein n=1 Tax=Dethiosulfatibacter aminovorans DSM 17477 TaxID=1121476 RepID=A0A1M6HHN2_9FIRM|nr:ABC transporter ATP-binding protein [Dethiosulfatibacter aminovorans]SHJ21652.1 energy-coupling factor transport system ATP-binding protein [Dethiosulfatibacter aminovorans DSM 17477]